jgi:hypothetical protein
MTEGVSSTGRVELTWPVSGSAVNPIGGGNCPTLAEIEVAFVQWIKEARRRGCPEGAPVGVGRDGIGAVPWPDLAVAWDASLSETGQ